MKDLSIVIVNWNTKQILDDCLQSVYDQTKSIDFEVVVVDNASEDDSVEMVKSKFPQVILIANDENVGFAAANNIGFRVCSGEYILLLNSDTIVLDSALEKTLAFARSRPDYGVVSCKILNDDRTLQPNCFMYPSLLNFTLFLLGLYKLFPKNKFFGRSEMTWWNYDEIMEVEVIKGCFMMVRSDALKEVGDMDERFFMYSEEVDWCFRYGKNGWKLGFFPDAETIHLGGISAARLGGDRALIKDKSTLRFMRKHWSKGRYSVAYTMMILFYLSRLPAVFILSVATKKERYSKIVDNHWTGLKGLLACKHD